MSNNIRYIIRIKYFSSHTVISELNDINGFFKFEKNIEVTFKFYIHEKIKVIVRCSLLFFIYLTNLIKKYKNITQYFNVKCNFLFMK